MPEEMFPPFEPAFFKHLLEDSPQAALVFDKDGQCIYFSPGLKRMLVRPPQELLGKPWTAFLQEIHSEDRPYMQSAWEKLFSGSDGSSISVLFRLKGRSGEFRLAEASAINRLHEGSIGGVVFHINLVVDRKLAEEMLMSERERLLVTLRSIGDGVIATDIEGRVTLLNKVSEQLTEWDQLDAVGKPLPEIFHIVNEESGQLCENPVEKVFRQGTVAALANHTVLVSKSGRRYSIEDSAAPIRNRNREMIGAVLVFRDVTQAKRNAEEISKVQKLESIGVLAGGIAHDFNNILTAIMGNASLALLQVQPHSKLFELLSDLSKATSRASELTQQLLTFAKGGSPVLQPSSLHAIVEESARFILHGSQVDCRFDLPANLKPAEIDKGQIGQVIQNLVLNAIQAMPDGGTIKIKAENVILPDDDQTPLPEGPYIRVAIQDHGIGIAKENLSRIFEPYFTTKKKGSGLGLSIVYSIMKNHRGWIRAESSIGSGTTFFLYLPAIENPVDSTLSQPHQKSSSSQGRALVMDDEEQPRKTVIQMLEYLGFRCSAAPHGESAVAACEESVKKGDRFDVVILDLTVPGGMGGKEAVKHIKVIDPEVRTIVYSGYSSDPILANFRDFGFDGCLAKPFTVADLSRVLNQVLED